MIIVNYSVWPEENIIMRVESRRKFENENDAKETAIKLIAFKHNTSFTMIFAKNEI